MVGEFMNLEEKTLSSTLIYDGRVVTLKKDEVELPNHNTSIREVVHNSGGACVIACVDNAIYFVKQFRYAHKKVVLELPAGKVNENGNEQPIDCAKRELTEETGLIADKIELLHTIYPTPAYTDEVIYIYTASGLKKGDINLDEDEFLNVEIIPISKVKEMLLSGEIVDGKTVVGLYAYFTKNNLW